MLVLLFWVTVLLLPLMMAVWTLSLTTAWSARAGNENAIGAKAKIMVIRCEDFISIDNVMVRANNSEPQASGSELI